MSPSRFLPLLGISLLGPLNGIDLNSDGLSDVWQQRFGAGALLPLIDSDGDGHTNAEEAIAGTDPFSSADCPQQTLIWAEAGFNPLHLDFQTKAGKIYQVSQSSNLRDFQPLGDPIPGKGSRVRLVGESFPLVYQGKTLPSHW